MQRRQVNHFLRCDGGSDAMPCKYCTVVGMMEFEGARLDMLAHNLFPQ